MDVGRVKVLLFLEISLCLLWTVLLSSQGHPARNQDDGIDLLAALNMSQPIKGVTRTPGEEPGTLVYKLRPRAPYLTLPRESSHFLSSALQSSMGIHLVGRQTLNSSSTLLSFSSSSSTVLQLSSSTLTKSLRLDYRTASGAKGLASLFLPGENPFLGEGWGQLALGLEPHRVSVFVDCREAVILWRNTEERLSLELPQDVVVTLASTPRENDSKFVGYLKTAEVSSRAYVRRPWHCDNVTDLGDDNIHGHKGEAPSSKPQPDYRSQGQPNQHVQEVQQDQPQRGVILGPPGSPLGGKAGAQAQGEERLRGLEERFEALARMLDMVKAQNADLQARVLYLEGCECVRRRCVWEGQEIEEGQRWETHLNTVCTCRSGQVTCEAHIKDPCLSNPCHNGGVCMALNSDPLGFHCSCPPDTKDPLCHTQQRKVSRTFEILEACWQPRPETNCQGQRSPQRRWFFNPTSGLCEDFLYCTGSGSNNFLSRKACMEQCIMGACCLRKPKRGQHGSNHGGYNVTNVDDMNENLNQHGDGGGVLHGDVDFNYLMEEALENDRKRGARKESDQSRTDCSEDGDFTYNCDYMSRKTCQARVKNTAGEDEAVSFFPSRKCPDVGCGGGCGCQSHRRLRRYGERFRQGCEECVCTHGGKVDCVCTHLTQRKEIRDLTLRERKQYQRAVRRLHAKPALWEGFAQLRADYSPQSGGYAYFLPWHRYFLWAVEHELQAVSSCQLAIPYFEWTVDSGSMQACAAWQAGLFGGDGEPGSSCVPQHPFQGWTPHSRWSPCLKRSFNTSVWLPDAVTVQRVLSQGNFQLLSQSLQAFSGLFRLWVGGHMASPLAAYDPLYLSHMAFIDKLWTQWQEKHQQVDRLKHSYRDKDADGEDLTHRGHYPARYRHVKMKPFDVTPSDVMSSQQQLCVTYVPITLGAPCNVTSSQTPAQRSDHTDDYSALKHPKQSAEKLTLDRSSFNSQSFHRSGFDLNGYDCDGFDRSGWDKRGFGRDGFNRDFVDRDGYDISGFNRYGFNRLNVSWFGMHWDGLFVTEEGEDGEQNHREEREDMSLRDTIMSELFSDGGYNVYGFDPFGLDHSGFDAFGFQTNGYDKDNCNWFFKGPHYLRFYFHTQQQLSSSSSQALSRITRTCPPITSLPLYWVMQDWMALGPEESSALIGRLAQEWVGQKNAHDDDYTIADNQNGWDIWLPITPDHRLCFKLHWYSSCPLGSPPVTCPDLCHQASCHGYPEAVCHVHNCGSCFTEWLDPSTGSHVICHGW